MVWVTQAAAGTLSRSAPASPRCRPEVLLAPLRVLLGRPPALLQLQSVQQLRKMGLQASVTFVKSVFFPVRVAL